MAEEIDFENGRNSNFEGLVTLTLTFDPAIRHIVLQQSSTSPYIPTFIQIEETFCGQTDVRTDGRTDGQTDGRTFFPSILLGWLSEVDLKILAQSQAAVGLQSITYKKTHCSPEYKMSPAQQTIEIDPGSPTHYTIPTADDLVWKTLKSTVNNSHTKAYDIICKPAKCFTLDRKLSACFNTWFHYVKDLC